MDYHQRKLCTQDCSKTGNDVRRQDMSSEECAGEEVGSDRKAVQNKERRRYIYTKINAVPVKVYAKKNVGKRMVCREAGRKKDGQSKGRLPCPSQCSHHDKEGQRDSGWTI